MCGNYELILVVMQYYDLMPKMYWAPFILQLMAAEIQGFRLELYALETAFRSVPKWNTAASQEWIYWGLK